MHADDFDPYSAAPRLGTPGHRDPFREPRGRFGLRQFDRGRRDPAPPFPRATDPRPLRADDSSTAEGVRLEASPEGVRRFTLQLEGGEVLISMDCAPRIVNDPFIHLLQRLLAWLSVRYGTRSTLKVVS